MKTTFSALLTLIMIGCTLFAHSTVLRVNNTPAITVPYASFQAAYDVAVNGDTIYLEGSGYSYGSLTLYKSLVIIGPGYFLNQNPETQANIASAGIYSLNLRTGSSGTKIAGLDISSITNNDQTVLQNIVFMRNRISNSMYNPYGTSPSSAYYSNFVFEQNFVDGSLSGRFENAVFRNNVFIGGVTINSLNNSVAFFNNVVGNANITMAPQCSNNIIYGSCTFTNCTLNNNVCSATQVPAGNGNQQNVDMNNVFVCYSSCTGYSSDARYQLKAGSPAIGAGSNSEDCGVFGGVDPYVLSGMPPIPAIYYFNYNYSNTAINVNMKVKSHN